MDIKKRRVPRIPVYKRGLLNYSLGRPGDDEKHTYVTLFELGALGCGMRSMVEIPSGTTIRITLFDQSEESYVTIKAHIIYANFDNISPLNSYGVVFDAIESGLGGLAYDLFNKLLKESTGFGLLDKPDSEKGLCF